MFNDDSNKSGSDERKRQSRNTLRPSNEFDDADEQQNMPTPPATGSSSNQQSQQQQAHAQPITTIQPYTRNTMPGMQVAIRHQQPHPVSTQSSTISISNTRTSSTSTSSRYCSSVIDTHTNMTIIQEFRRLVDEEEEADKERNTRTPANSPETRSNDGTTSNTVVNNIDELPPIPSTKKRNQTVMQMRHAAMREAQRRTRQSQPSCNAMFRISPIRRPAGGGDRDFQRAVARITTRLRLARQRLQSSVAVLKHLETRVSNAEQSSDSELEFDPPARPPIPRPAKRSKRKQQNPQRIPLNARPTRADTPMNRVLAARQRQKRRAMLQSPPAKPPAQTVAKVPDKEPALRNNEPLNWPDVERYIEAQKRRPEPVVQRSFSIVRQYEEGEQPSHSRHVESPSAHAWALPSTHRMRIPVEVKKALQVYANGRVVSNDASPARNDYVFRPPYVIQQRTTIYKLKRMQHELQQQQQQQQAAIEECEMPTDHLALEDCMDDGNNEYDGENMHDDNDANDTGVESDEAQLTSAGEMSGDQTDSDDN